MKEKHSSRFVASIVWALAWGLAAIAGCSSSSTTTTTGSGGNGGAPSTTLTTGTLATSTGGGTSAGGATSTGGGAGGATSTGGAAGAATDASVPPGDAGAACSGETPAGTTACGAGKTCHLTSCGPPAQFACFAAGAAALGGTCMNNLDCGAGLNCISYSATLRACEKQCNTDSDCPNARCAEYTTCNMAIRGKFCLRACSDVTAAGAAVCGTGFKCDGVCVGDTARKVCLAAGAARSGACVSNTECAPGYTCISLSTDGGTSSSCTQLCRTNTDCTAGMCVGNIGCGTMATDLHFCQ